MAAPLTGQDKARLRSRGQTLEPALAVGKGGFSANVRAELDRLLRQHELVKVKLLAEREERAKLIEEIAAQSAAEVAGTVGKTVLLWRAKGP
jgi:RNA-binding protein